MTVSLDPPSTGHSEADAERVMREVLQRLQEIPLVERSAIANSGLLNGGAASSTITIQCDRRFTGDRAAIRLRVGPGFLRDARHADDRRARLSTSATCVRRATSREPTVR